MKLQSLTIHISPENHPVSSVIDAVYHDGQTTRVRRFAVLEFAEPEAIDRLIDEAAHAGPD